MPKFNKGDLVVPVKNTGHQLEAAYYEVFEDIDIFYVFDDLGKFMVLQYADGSAGVWSDYFEIWLDDKNSFKKPEKETKQHIDLDWEDYDLLGNRYDN